MSLEQFGANGSAPERAVTYPVRALARTFGPMPRSVAENIWREGVVGGVVDTGVQMAGRMTVEAFRMITGPIGFVLGKTRDAVGATLYHTGRIGWQLAKRAPIFPVTAANRVASERAADPDATATTGALSRLNSLWQEERNRAR